MKYEATLKDKKEAAEGTVEFILEKPAGFEFRAGQSIDLTLIDPPETDAEGNMRAFSIAAAPHEDHLAIATRMRDTAFKRVLGRMAPGTRMQVEGPFGDFTLHKNEARPAIFLVGGIGITPFRSILKDAERNKLPHKLYLFYSNRRPEDAAFLEELQAMPVQNSNLTFVPTMTDMAKSSRPWDGETGYITMDLIRKYAPDAANAVYYTAGPQKMVAAMRQLLVDAGVSEDDIKTEEFAGY